jgi:hypothetical protein
MKMSMKKTMKTTMKIMAAMAVMMGFAFNAMGQSNTDNDAIAGKAQVLQAMAVTKQVDLDFGMVSQGSAKTIGLTNNVTGTPNLGTQTTGRFLVSAAAGTSVNLTFTTPTNLVYDVNNLPIGTYVCGYANDNAYSSSAVSFGAPGTVTKDIASFPTNDVGSSVNGVYVFIGATVSPTSSQAVGSYTANITLTATYN